MLAETFSDPENARIIFLMSGGLVVLALLLAFGTVWWWRSCKVEHPALGPLEVMGTRSWWKGDYSTRKRSVEAVRPVGEVIDGAASAADVVDLQALVRSTPPHFDDLLDPVGALALDDGREEAADADIVDADIVDAAPAPVLADVVVDVPVVTDVDAELDAELAEIDETLQSAGSVSIDPLLRPNAVE